MADLADSPPSAKREGTRPACPQLGASPPAYMYLPRRHEALSNRHTSGWGSGLEAFSLTPAVVALGHPAGRRSPEPEDRPFCSSRTGKDYRSDDAVNSRVKLTCLTTV